MKKKIATTILSLVAVYGSAQESTTELTSQSSARPTPIEVTILPTEERLPKQGFSYLRATAMPTAEVGFAPGLAYGYRLHSGRSALDLSVGFSGGTKSHSSAYSFTLPKANYLFYLDPKQDASAYFGGGLAYTIMHGTKRVEVANNCDNCDIDYDFGGGHYYETSSFSGLVANAAVGYEMMRGERFCSFVQCDINQPVVAASTQGKFPGPSIEFSIGAGW
ncbi:MAG: hypothetical protein RL235_768 [Chlamydiota bacterium]